jgi:RNA polymerase sigma-54 factor
MAIKLKQSLSQTQGLTMTPQLQQAIKLLTLNHLEMTNLIAQEMVENPTLEELGAGNESSDVEGTGETDSLLEGLENQNKEAKSEDFQEESFVNKDDFDWQNYIETYNNQSHTPPDMVGRDHSEVPTFDNVSTGATSLADHLEWQLRMMDFSENEWVLLEKIVYNINDDGYLEVPFDEIISEVDFKRDAAFEVLSKVQELDPIGCGAQNLKECLLAQARVKDERSPLLEKIIRNHLEDIQRLSTVKLAQAVGVSEEQIKLTLELLQEFHPRPGRLIVTNEIHYIVPDIYVVKTGEEFTVQVNDDGVPRLRISPFYKNMLLTQAKGAKQTSDGKDASDFVEDKIKSAMFLIKSIQKRQKTIYRVAHAILRQQQDFFKKGPEHLKPMVLRDIANELGVHESTVSRVTSNKYMHTPIGMFELKYFFNTGVGGKAGGADVASEVLRLKIKGLIDNEKTARPLSDQKIVELLSREDLKVARRTVAKYREMLGIPSSAKRKST